MSDKSFTVVDEKFKKILVNRLIDLTRDKGGTDYQILRLLDGNNSLENIAEDIARPPRWERSYNLQFDCFKSFHELVSFGKFRNVDPSFTSTNFPLDTQGQHEAKLIIIQFEGWVNIRDLEEHAKKYRLRFANTAHALAFAAKRKSLLRGEDSKQESIIFLGSAWVDSCGKKWSPEIRKYAKGQDLILHPYDNEMHHGGHYFAFVRDEQPSN